MPILSFEYPAHSNFVRPAHKRAHLWRLGLGIVLLAAFFLVLSNLVIGTIMGMLNPETANAVWHQAATGQSASGMLLLLVQIALLGVATAMVVVVVHKRAPLTLIGPTRLAIRQFGAVLFVLLLLHIALAVLPPYAVDQDPVQRNMSFGIWLALLPFSLLAILAQISAEEVVFRGYLQQQLAARFKSPLIWIIAPSVLFGAGHYLPGSAGTNATTIAIWACVFGLLLADLTARSGTLGPALAMHFSNNVYAMVFVATPDQMSGLALYVLPFGIGDEDAIAAWLPVDFALMLVSWLAARLALRV